MNKKNLGIIFHTSSYDRLYHGLSLALAALALGRQVSLFFSYWALGYLKKDKAETFQLDGEASSYQEILQKQINQGHLLKITELFAQVKGLGGKFYACTSSMGLLNIARDELQGVVDKSMGITTFLTETSDYQILFI